jgi:uncharacterized RDD family membrane protein YckC
MKGNISTVTKRFLAFGIDYVVILIYALLLLGLTLLAGRVFGINPKAIGPVAGEIAGFLFLTLPVILYFTLCESGRFAGTIGKQKFKLRVAGFVQLLARNCMKFLPWELAHFLVFRLYNFPSGRMNAPGWVTTGLIAPYALVLVYLLFILFNKNNRSVYEIFSGTRVLSA